MFFLVYIKFINKNLGDFFITGNALKEDTSGLIPSDQILLCIQIKNTYILDWIGKNPHTVKWIIPAFFKYKLLKENLHYIL